ncbi:uncharacterized protein LOC110706504 [Chenopodium quinoa]|uniref:uncharacterized protein LOC110706504 n=1 Tax=Chenopodium quinoa TaxID=63459 RepID=UPI000B76E36C|nr:uncharacterized protein LOC110706504 [Chenopodium quinoa]
MVSWEAPPTNFYKLNFDGSVLNKSATTGILIRDSSGAILGARAFNLGTTKVFITEAMAIHKGILLALEREIKNIIIEGDNLLVINSVNGIWSTPWQIDHIIQDICSLLSNFDNWSIRHIFREANQAADWIANVGHLVSDSMDIVPCNRGDQSPKSITVYSKWSPKSVTVHGNRNPKSVTVHGNRF